MTDEMTPRERMLAAMRNQTPDRVPVAPDISNMIPCRLTGRPSYEIYANNQPTLGDAYINAVKQLGIDGWYIYASLAYRYPAAVDERIEFIEKTSARWVARHTVETPAGNLSETLVYPCDNPPTTTEKFIKNIEEDLDKYRYLYQVPTSYDDDAFQQEKKNLGELGAFGVGVYTPGLHVWCNILDGSLETATYAYYDYPELFEELRQLHEAQALKQVEMLLDAGVDFILTGGSGSVTLQSPEIWRELSLPTLKKITRMCRQAGVICGVHSCGKERYLLETCYQETDLDYINPLEIEPMGDCTLKDAARFGDKLCIMGNLHTTNVMLEGSTDLVRLESLRAIRDAGQAGGFILSTGDQCGRDTPLENIREMVKVGQEFGRYPLDMGAIDAEIARLEKLV